MHIPDGFLSNEVNAATAVVAGVVCVFAAWRARKTLGDGDVPLLGMAAAFIFAAQMLNFPVVGGTSGHFLGSAFAAALLGPLNACLCMAMVLAVQCFGFGDGGVTALGSNVLNMGIVGAFAGMAVTTFLAALLPRTRAGLTLAAGAGAWCAVVLAAAVCSLELVVSGRFEASVVFPAMLSVHSLIGIGEAVITAAALSVILAARSDLVRGLRGMTEGLAPAARRPRVSSWLVVVGGIAAAVVLSFVVSQWASKAPDGLDSVARKNGVEESAPVYTAAPMKDYEVSGVDSEWLRTGLAGLAGTVVVLGAMWGTGVALRRRRHPA
jgi:cobalt/nickel transport system permease protein